jgi:hypothetical protein
MAESQQRPMNSGLQCASPNALQAGGGGSGWSSHPWPAGGLEPLPKPWLALF